MVVVTFLKNVIGWSEVSLARRVIKYEEED